MEQSALCNKLLSYCLQGRVKKMKQIFEENTISADVTNEEDQTLLYISCLHGHIKVASMLLDLGADPNRRSSDGSTPTHAAAFSGCEGVLRLVVLNGGDLRLHDNLGKTAKDWTVSAEGRKNRRILEIIKTWQKIVDRDILRTQERVENGVDSVSSLLELLGMNDHAVSNIKLLPDHHGHGAFLSLPFNGLLCRGIGLASVIPLAFPAQFSVPDGESSVCYKSPACFNMEGMWWCGHRVTVKRVRRQNSDCTLNDTEDLLISELNANSHLRHPNLLMLMAVCLTSSCNSYTTAPQHWLVYEPVYVGSLHQLLHKRHALLSITDAAKMLLQVADALMYMHERGFIHCAVTSHSIHVTENLRVKLGDLAFMCRAGQNAMPANPLPTALNRWLAPEILLKLPASFATDVFGFCIVTSESITKKIPWPGYACEQIADVVSAGKKCGALPDTIPAVIKPLLTNGLRHHANKRIVTIKRISHGLRSLLNAGSRTALLRSVSAPGWAFCDPTAPLVELCDGLDSDSAHSSAVLSLGRGCDVPDSKPLDPRAEGAPQERNRSQISERVMNCSSTTPVFRPIQPHLEGSTEQSEVSQRRIGRASAPLPTTNKDTWPASRPPHPSTKPGAQNNSPVHCIDGRGKEVRPVEMSTLEFGSKGKGSMLASCALDVPLYFPSMGESSSIRMPDLDGGELSSRSTNAIQTDPLNGVHKALHTGKDILATSNVNLKKDIHSSSALGTAGALQPNDMYQPRFRSNSLGSIPRRTGNFALSHSKCIGKEQSDKQITAGDLLKERDPADRPDAYPRYRSNSLGAYPRRVSNLWTHSERSGGKQCRKSHAMSALEVGDARDDGSKVSPPCQGGRHGSSEAACSHSGATAIRKSRVTDFVSKAPPSSKVEGRTGTCGTARKEQTSFPGTDSLHTHSPITAGENKGPSDYQPMSSTHEHRLHGSQHTVVARNSEVSENTGRVQPLSPTLCFHVPVQMQPLNNHPNFDAIEASIGKETKNKGKGKEKPLALTTQALGSTQSQVVCGTFDAVAATVGKEGIIDTGQEGPSNGNVLKNANKIQSKSFNSGAHAHYASHHTSTITGRAQSRSLSSNLHTGTFQSKSPPSATYVPDASYDSFYERATRLLDTDEAVCKSDMNHHYFVQPNAALQRRHSVPFKLQPAGELLEREQCSETGFIMETDAVDGKQPFPGITRQAAVDRHDLQYDEGSVYKESDEAISDCGDSMDLELVVPASATPRLSARSPERAELDCDGRPVVREKEGDLLDHSRLDYQGRFEDRERERRYSIGSQDLEHIFADFAQRNSIEKYSTEDMPETRQIDEGKTSRYLTSVFDGVNHANEEHFSNSHLTQRNSIKDDTFEETRQMRQIHEGQASRYSSGPCHRNEGSLPHAPDTKLNSIDRYPYKETRHTNPTQIHRYLDSVVDGVCHTSEPVSYMHSVPGTFDDCSANFFTAQFNDTVQAEDRSIPARNTARTMAQTNSKHAESSAVDGFCHTSTKCSRMHVPRTNHHTPDHRASSVKYSHTITDPTFLSRTIAGRVSRTRPIHDTAGSCAIPSVARPIKQPLVQNACNQNPQSVQHFSSDDFYPAPSDFTILKNSIEKMTQTENESHPLDAHNEINSSSQEETLDSSQFESCEQTLTSETIPVRRASSESACDTKLFTTAWASAEDGTFAQSADDIRDDTPVTKYVTAIPPNRRGIMPKSKQMSKFRIFSTGCLPGTLTSDGCDETVGLDVTPSKWPFTKKRLVFENPTSRERLESAETHKRSSRNVGGKVVSSNTVGNTASTALDASLLPGEDPEVCVVHSKSVQTSEPFYGAANMQVSPRGTTAAAASYPTNVGISVPYGSKDHKIHSTDNGESEPFYEAANVPPRGTTAAVPFNHATVDAATPYRNIVKGQRIHNMDVGTDTRDSRIGRHSKVKAPMSTCATADAVPYNHTDLSTSGPYQNSGKVKSTNVGTSGLYTNLVRAPVTSLTSDAAPGNDTSVDTSAPYQNSGKTEKTKTRNVGTSEGSVPPDYTNLGTAVHYENSGKAQKAKSTGVETSEPYTNVVKAPVTSCASGAVPCNPATMEAPVKQTRSADVGTSEGSYSNVFKTPVTSCAPDAMPSNPADVGSSVLAGELGDAQRFHGRNMATERPTCEPYAPLPSYADTDTVSAISSIVDTSVSSTYATVNTIACETDVENVSATDIGVHEKGGKFTEDPIRKAGSPVHGEGGHVGPLPSWLNDGAGPAATPSGWSFTKKRSYFENPHAERLPMENLHSSLEALRNPLRPLLPTSPRLVGGKTSTPVGLNLHQNDKVKCKDVSGPRCFADILKDIERSSSPILRRRHTLGVARPHKDACDVHMKNCGEKDCRIHAPRRSGDEAKVTLKAELFKKARVTCSSNCGASKRAGATGCQNMQKTNQDTTKSEVTQGGFLAKRGQSDILTQEVSHLLSDVVGQALDGVAEELERFESGRSTPASVEDALDPIVKEERPYPDTAPQGMWETEAGQALVVSGEGVGSLDTSETHCTTDQCDAHVLGHCAGQRLSKGHIDTSVRYCISSDQDQYNAYPPNHCTEQRLSKGVKLDSKKLAAVDAVEDGEPLSLKGVEVPHPTKVPEGRLSVETNQNSNGRSAVNARQGKEPHSLCEGTFSKKTNQDTNGEIAGNTGQGEEPVSGISSNVTDSRMPYMADQDDTHASDWPEGSKSTNVYLKGVGAASTGQDKHEGLGSEEDLQGSTTYSSEVLQNTETESFQSNFCEDSEFHFSLQSDISTTNPPGGAVPNAADVRGEERTDDFEIVNIIPPDGAVPSATDVSGEEQTGDQYGLFSTSGVSEEGGQDFSSLVLAEGKLEGQSGYSRDTSVWSVSAEQK